MIFDPVKERTADAATAAFYLGRRAAAAPSGIAKVPAGASVFLIC
jgi:hypothetical protein